MAADTSAASDQALFPLDLKFARDLTTLSFDTAPEYSHWRTLEQQFWNNYAGNNDHFAFAFRENGTSVRDQNEQNEATFRNNLDRFQETYVPSSSTFVKAAQRLSSTSPM